MRMASGVGGISSEKCVTSSDNQKVVRIHFSLQGSTYLCLGLLAQPFIFFTHSSLNSMLLLVVRKFLGSFATYGQRYQTAVSMLTKQDRVAQGFEATG